MAIRPISPTLSQLATPTHTGILSPSFWRKSTSSHSRQSDPEQQTEHYSTTMKASFYAAAVGVVAAGLAAAPPVVKATPVTAQV